MPPHHTFKDLLFREVNEVIFQKEFDNIMFQCRLRVYNYLEERVKGKMTRCQSFEGGGQTEMISTNMRPSFELRKQKGRLVSGNAMPGQKCLKEGGTR